MIEGEVVTHLPSLSILQIIHEQLEIERILKVMIECPRAMAGRCLSTWVYGHSITVDQPVNGYETILHSRT